MSEINDVFYCLEPCCKSNRLITDYKDSIIHVMEKHNLVEYDKFQELLSLKFSDQNIKNMLGNLTVKYIQDIVLEKIQNLHDQINILEMYILNVFPNEFDKYILPTSSIIQTAQKFKNLTFSNQYKDNILFYEKEMTQFLEAYQNNFLPQNKHELLIEKIRSDIEAFKFEFYIQIIIETFQSWINNYDSNNNKLIQSKPINQTSIFQTFPQNNTQLIQQSQQLQQSNSQSFQEYLNDSQYEFIKIGRGQVYLNYHHTYVYSQQSAKVLIEVEKNEYFHEINLQINRIEPHNGLKNKITIGFFSDEDEEILIVYGQRLIEGDISINIDNYHEELVVGNNDSNFSKRFNICPNKISKIIIFFTGYEMYLRS